MSFRTMLSCVILLYAIVCIPVYAASLMQVFNAAIMFNLVCMVLLAGLITYDLFQDHNPLRVVLEKAKEELGEE